VAAGPRVGWQQAIATTVAGLGYDLVDVERAQRGLLRVTIDRLPGRSYTVGRGPNAVQDDGEFITVDDCEAVTRQLQYALEVEGLDYARLEVSSPGLDRPLKRESDYQRFAGLAVSITLKQPFEGRKSWQGVLSAAEGGGWQLVFKNGKTEQVLGFTLQEVREARLVPVVDFKGRKAGVGPAGGADKAGAQPSPEVDGGL
jgi:ribosome maturation factor RimP